MTYAQILAATRGLESVGGSPLDRALQYDDLLAERARYEVPKMETRLDNCRRLFDLLESVQQALAKDDRLRAQVPAVVAIRAAVVKEYRGPPLHAAKGAGEAVHGAG